MKSTFLIVSLLFCIKIAFCQSSPTPDIILYNAKVGNSNTENPMYSAIAVKTDKIIAVGKDHELLRTKGKKTKLIDAGGKTIIPGLFDSHLHVIRGGRFYNAELRWDGVKTLKRALAMLKEQAGRTPEGQWVRVVGGWNEYQFEEKRLPTIEEINQATGEVPAFILYLYGKAWVNRAGLAKLRIDSTVNNPAGGLFQRDDKGNPTGLLVAEPNAYILYSTLARLPELSVADQLNSTTQFMHELNRLGITAAMDAGGGFQNFPGDYAVMDSLQRVGKITLHLPYFLFAQQKGNELADFTRWTHMVSFDEMFSENIHQKGYYADGAGENLVADAADFENFLFPRPELPSSMEANLKNVITLLIQKRWPFRIHATYNETITRILNVVEEVNHVSPLDGLPFILDHVETISDSNLIRVKKIGGRISIQHRMAFQGESFVHRYGVAAAAAAPPVKKMLALGIPVGAGTDATRVASYNPWVCLEWLVTGKTIGGSQVMTSENVLDRQTAIDLFTVGSYSLGGTSVNSGKIEKGYAADLVILNKDYYSVPAEQVHTISSVMTIVGGKIVYDANIPAIKASPEWSPVNFYGGYQLN